MTKGEIAQSEQFLLLPQRFQLFTVIKPTFIYCFRDFAKMFLKSSDADLLYVAKGNIHGSRILQIVMKTLTNLFKKSYPDAMV